MSQTWAFTCLLLSRDKRHGKTRSESFDVKTKKQQRIIWKINDGREMILQTSWTFDVITELHYEARSPSGEHLIIRVYSLLVELSIKLPGNIHLLFAPFWHQTVKWWEDFALKNYCLGSKFKYQMWDHSGIFHKHFIYSHLQLFLTTPRKLRRLTLLFSKCWFFFPLETLNQLK